MRALSLKGAILLILGLFIGFSPLHTYAEEEQPSCGNFIFGEEVQPVIDCDNPFGILSVNENLVVSFNETTIQNNGSYPFLGNEGSFVLTGTHPDAFFIESTLYKKEGIDYRYIESQQGKYTFEEAGTYVLVVTEDPKPEITYTIFKKIINALVPTVYAFPGTSLIITFEVTQVTDTSSRISNILFLPGIQASRLYTKDEDGDEEKLWEPFGDDEVEQLAMTETGESVEDIYAKDIIDKIVFSGTVYEEFLTFLDGLGSNHLKPTIGVFPYDWRYDVFTVADRGIRNNDGSYTNTVHALEYLATTSITGKVTLIAHSNGGLLAKAIMQKLEQEGKTHLIDKIIFIAVPHLGTPKGIMALLHGYDQGHALGLVSTAEGVRSVMKNMPGVYGLLPSEAFIDSLSGPMISFDDSESTEVFRNAYGFTISDMDEYIRFLNGTEGRISAINRVNEASTANSSLLTRALEGHKEKLDTWEAPAGVRVFNIVGTGLPTPNAIEYRGFEDVVCAGSVCKKIEKIEPVIRFTNYGDQTVVSKSTSSKISNNFFIDLSAVEGYKHVDITEAKEIQDLIDAILHGSSTEGVGFVTTSEPLSQASTKIITIHSPARIFIQDTKGNITGRIEKGGTWKSEIPGSDYFEVGEVKYAFVPDDGTYSIIIEGEGSGVYTHEVKQLRGNQEEMQHRFTATVTPEMVAKYTDKGGVLSDVVIDVNGDGEVDLTMSQDGALLFKLATYSDLNNALATLSLPVVQKRLLIGLAHQAEEYSKSNKRIKQTAEKIVLVMIKNKINFFVKSGFIPIEKGKEIREIINNLLIKK